MDLQRQLYKERLISVSVPRSESLDSRKKTREIELLDHASQHSKRLYMTDVIILQGMAKRGFGTSKAISQRHGYSRRASNYHLRKLEILGFIERIGRRRCPFQWYRIPRKTEIPVHHVLKYLIDLFAENPTRTYFFIDFLCATLPCSYGCSSDVARPDGASVPFGVRRGPGEWLEPVWLPFWIPVECLEEVVWFLDELSVTWWYFDEASISWQAYFPSDFYS